jgi:hypothetical protein
VIFKQIPEILSGKKTQTRRIVKPDHNWLTPSLEDRTTVLKVWNETLDDYVPTHGPTIYAVGHTYAVVPKRGEACLWWGEDENGSRYSFTPQYQQWCAAAGDDYTAYTEDDLRRDGCAPMRIRITAIRREPLQAITEADARAEGVESVEAYRELWDSINNRKGARWPDNPWVWVLEFELVTG